MKNSTRPSTLAKTIQAVRDGVPVYPHQTNCGTSCHVGDAVVTLGNDLKWRLEGTSGWGGWSFASAAPGEKQDASGVLLNEVQSAVMNAAIRGRI